MKFGRRDSTASKPHGTPVRQKVKHRQSAKHCDCYQDSSDQNLERNYILSLIAKSLPPPKNNSEKNKIPLGNDTCEKKVGNNKKKDEDNDKKKRKRDKEKNSKKNSKNALERVTSITLKRNQIVPLDDGSGGCVLVSQLTTITEKPKKEDKKEEPKKKFNFLQRLASIKRSARKFLSRRRSKKEAKVVEEPTKKQFVEFEKIPSQDDFIEECFQEEEEVPLEATVPVEVGRVSVCSSGYFTPVGESPNAWRRMMQTETDEFYKDTIDGDVFEDADTDSGFVGSSCSGSSRSSSHGEAMAVDSIRNTLDVEGHVDHEELRRRFRAGEPLYPNNDCSIWMRTCEQEIIEPIRGKTFGMIPVWLKGTLLRNGPGSLKVGDMTFQHLFDGSALVHRDLFYATQLIDEITEENSLSVVRLLNVHGARGDLVVPERGVAALHVLAGLENEEFSVKILEKMLEQGLDVDVFSEEGWTPLHVAAAWGRCKAIQILLVNNAHPNILDRINSLTPSGLALKESQWKAYNILLTYNVIVEDIDKLEKYQVENEIKDSGDEEKGCIGFEDIEKSVNLEEMFPRKESIYSSARRGLEDPRVFKVKSDLRSYKIDSNIDLPDDESREWNGFRNSDGSLFLNENAMKMIKSHRKNSKVYESSLEDGPDDDRLNATSDYRAPCSPLSRDRIEKVRDKLSKINQHKMSYYETRYLRKSRSSEAKLDDCMTCSLKKESRKTKPEDKNTCGTEDKRSRGNIKAEDEMYFCGIAESRCKSKSRGLNKSSRFSRSSESMISGIESLKAANSRMLTSVSRIFLFMLKKRHIYETVK